jgi:hypothetical protein
VGISCPPDFDRRLTQDKTAPVKELKVPVTLAQADDVAARLR